MADGQDATNAARSLDADLARIAWRTPEGAHVLDGAFAPALFSARAVERLSARRLDVATRLSACRQPSHSRRALAGILLAFVVCPSCRFASLPARRVVLPLHFEDTACARAYLRSARRTIACMAATAGPWTLQPTSLRAVALNLTPRSDSHPPQHHRLARLHLAPLKFATPRIIGFCVFYPVCASLIDELQHGCTRRAQLRVLRSTRRVHGRVTASANGPGRHVRTAVGA
jgi:hypothetical protein